MSRQYYCASCGAELVVYQKAIKSAGRVVYLVGPHECKEVNEEFDLKDMEEAPKDIDKMFDGFDFVQKLNKANKNYEIEKPETKDERPPRDELTSTAPPNVLSAGRS